MAQSRSAGDPQNLTVRLDGETIRKAKVLAAKLGTSVSRLVADTVERLISEDDAWEVAHRRALRNLSRGFALGGRMRATRDELHER